MNKSSRNFTFEAKYCKIVVQKMNTSLRSVQAGEFLGKLGLNGEEIKIFSALSQTGSLTVLELSRLTGINRTRLYRLLEKLEKKGFTEEIVEAHKKMVKAVGTDRLEILIKEEETKAKFLKNSFPSIAGFLSAQKSSASWRTNVLFYRGREGVRQQVWNTLRTNGEILGYSYRPLIELIGDYYIKWYEEWTKRQLKMRDLYSDQYVESRNKIKGDLIDSNDFPIKNIDSRYISSKILDITHQIDIYNDVVSYYSWHEGEIFGVEIYNGKIALMQKQLFEIVWKMAKK